jgi:uncharacterized membrane protein (GlpM family)
VEEQFYLFFPPFVLLLQHYCRRCLVPALFLIAIGSLAFAEWQSTRQADSAFFDTRGRIWELLCGSLLACLAPSGRAKNIPRLLVETGALAGLLMVVLAVVFFSKATPFPSLYGLVPVLGTVAIIFFATQRTFVGRLLGSRPFVMVGLISYSAYLWHQPLFAFVRVRSADSPSPDLMFGLAALTLVLAYVSWRFVEQPCRNPCRLSSRTLYGATGSTCFLLVFAGFFVTANGGLRQRYDESDFDLLQPAAKHAEYVRDYFSTLVPLGPEKTPGLKRLLLVGDSFCQDLINMFNEAKAFPDFDKRVIYVPRRCQIYLGEGDVSSFRSGKHCQKDYGALIREYASKADIVILTSSWQAWAAERLPETLNNIRSFTDAKILIVGRKSFGRINRSDLVKLQKTDKVSYRNELPSTHIAVNDMMRLNLPPNVFIDLHSVICGDMAITSPVFSPEGNILSYDGGHLTEAGAKFIGRRLMSHPLLSPYSGLNK